MSHAIRRSIDSATRILIQDAKALTDFLYATPERSRITLFLCIMALAYVVIGNSLQHLAQLQGACSF